jgi:restriction endonuclease S subunit
MAQKETIRTLAEIQLGYQLRKKPEAAEAGGILLIQLRDINKDRTALEFSADTVRFNPERGIEKQLLTEGDVLFMAKGSKPFACTVRNLPGPAVANGMFFILRPDTQRVAPEYLAWALNRDEAVRALMNASGTGVTMPVIRRSVLEEFTITLPPLEIQQRIGELNRLAEEEQELLKGLAEQKEKLIRAICEEISNKETTHE